MFQEGNLVEEADHVTGVPPGISSICTILRKLCDYKPSDHKIKAMDSTNSDPRRNCPTLLDVLGQYGIFDMLCRRLDTATLFSLRLVTKRLANHFAAHAKERWNFNRRLKHFVRNPQSLRTLMARYNALISGSFVIQFFDDSFWKESDLDIYVERESAAAFGTHLCQKEGYRFDRGSTEDDDYDFLGFVQVITMLICSLSDC